MRVSLTTFKPVSVILVGMIFWLYGDLWLYGQSRAIESDRKAQSNRFSPPKSALDNRFDATLSELKDVIQRGASETKTAPEKGFARIAKLTELKERLVKENEKVQTYFNRLQDAIKQKHLSGEILNRQVEFVRSYNSKYQALISHLEGIESAHQTATGFLGKLTGRSKEVNWDDLTGRTLSFLEENTPKPRRSNFDPNNLPHRSLKADKAIPPKLTREEWLKAFPESPLWKESASAQQSAAKTEGRSLLGTAPPTDADLAETIEVKFTPEITQLANSLGKNPVKIFNWVRNNIEFVPTWGSIQGAGLCMENRAGNAFDTASLLIALLRVSGIPARYQMGTIEVPVGKAMNWLGGFTNANAAARLAASGGIPSAGTVSTDDTIQRIRLEHVWVKAYIDYAPSGGAVNIAGNTWIEIDPSFKQVTFANGLDLTPVITDIAPLISQANQNAITNAATGSVTGINVDPIDQALMASKDQITNLVNKTFPNGASPRDLVRANKQIISANFSILAPRAPYHVLVRANPLSEIPDSLRHRITFTLTDATGVTDFSFSQSLPEVAGKRVILGSAVATKADAQVVGGPWASATQTDIHAFPTSFPARLIYIIPQLRIDGQTVAGGSAVSLGTNRSLRIHFYAPTVETPDFNSDVLAGETFAIGIDHQGISADQLDRMIKRLNSTVNSLDSRSFKDIAVTSLVEDPLAAVVMSWFSWVDRFASNAGHISGLVSLRYPSAGTFSYRFQTTSLFGAVSSVSPVAYALDIGRDLVINVARDGDTRKEILFTFLQAASGSHHEHLIPDVVFHKDAANNAAGSTTTLLAEANSQHIPIYKINSANASSIIPILQVGADEKSNIEDAIASGKVVITSERPVTTNGIQLLGKIVFDPKTGSAGFQVSQQLNGWLLYLCSQCNGLKGDAQIDCLVGTGGLDVGCLGSVIAFVSLALLLVSLPGADLTLADLFAEFPALARLAIVIENLPKATSLAASLIGLALFVYEFTVCSFVITEVVHGLIESKLPLDDPLALLGEILIGVILLTKGCIFYPSPTAAGFRNGDNLLSIMGHMGYGTNELLGMTDGLSASRLVRSLGESFSRSDSRILQQAMSFTQAALVPSHHPEMLSHQASFGRTLATGRSVNLFSREPNLILAVGSPLCA